MPRKSLIAKAKKKQRFKVREHNRCNHCGRARGYYRKFGLCRLCLREHVLRGEVPGVIKSSW